MKSRLVPYFLAAVLLADLCFSFAQYYHAPLDGDLAAIVLPTGQYQKVLSDPFGWDAAVHHVQYASPNRFFVHWAMSHYFKAAPHALQAVLSPIDSVYAAAALLKIALHAMMLFLLASYAQIFLPARSRGRLETAVLMAPLLHATAFNGQIGIVLGSVTYTCFYTLPLVFLLLFFLPFFRRNTPLMPRWQMPLWFFLALALPFSGPLVPAIVLLVCPTVIAWHFLKKSEIDRHTLFWFAGISLWSLYSMYVGLFNTENPVETPAIFARYGRLLIGLGELLSIRIGLSLLLFCVLLNAWLLRRRQNDAEAAGLLRFFCWAGLFALAYLLLLPLGGYREYRPNFVRSDTLMPVNVCLILFFGISTRYLMQFARQLRAWTVFLAAVLMIYWLSDALHLNANARERTAMEQLARAGAQEVQLAPDTVFLGWTTDNPAWVREANAELLQYWGITKEKVRYRH